MTLEEKKEYYFKNKKKINRKRVEGYLREANKLLGGGEFIPTQVQVNIIGLMLQLEEIMSFNFSDWRDRE